MKILIVDDHQLVAEGISSLLQEDEFAKKVGGHVSVDIVSTVAEAEPLLTTTPSYDLLLLDLSMPELNGFDCLNLLEESGASLPVVILSASDHMPDIQRAYRMGARGYISKFEATDGMLNKIETVVLGGDSFPDDLYLMLEMESKGGKSPLTPRQIEVLSLMADGKSNKEIAAQLEVSTATIKYHIAEMFRLLNVKNRTLCVKEALNQGLLR